MAALSPHQAERARKYETLLIQALSHVGGNEVAASLNTSQATVSRLKSQFQDFAQLMARCSLKVVPLHYECVEPKVFEAVTTLAGMKLDSLRRKPDEAFVESPTLSFEEPE